MLEKNTYQLAFAFQPSKSLQWPLHDGCWASGNWVSSSHTTMTWMFSCMSPWEGLDNTTIITAPQIRSQLQVCFSQLWWVKHSVRVFVKKKKNFLQAAVERGAPGSSAQLSSELPNRRDPKGWLSTSAFLFQFFLLSFSKWRMAIGRVDSFPVSVDF